MIFIGGFLTCGLHFFESAMVMSSVSLGSIESWGRDIAHKQVTTLAPYLLAHERQRALHLFIAPDISAGLAAKEQDDIWGDRLLLRSWFDVLNVMQDGLAGPEHIPLQRWKKEVINCLQKLSIHPLGGF
jgi:hypothetical protein